MYCAQLNYQDRQPDAPPVFTVEELRSRMFPYFASWIAQLGINGSSLDVRKHHTVASFIGASYRKGVDINRFSPEQWTKVVEFIRRPIESAVALGIEWPQSKGHRAQFAAAAAPPRSLVEPMEGELPAFLAPSLPTARAFPPSWRDAAIRTLYDRQSGGVRCQSCSRQHCRPAELRRMHCDHIVPYSRGGLMAWGAFSCCARHEFQREWRCIARSLNKSMLQMSFPSQTARPRRIPFRETFPRSHPRAVKPICW